MTSTLINRSQNKRSDIQGLRALAVILVILNHLNIKYFGGGFIGVDIFFTISGYLISAIIIDEFGATGKFNFLEFYIRRIRRLLPSLLVMCATTVIAATIVLTKYESALQLGSTAYTLTWLSNFYFAFEGISYFDELQDKDLFLHTWSLAVEEQFYLIWPALIIALLSLKKIARNPFQGLVALTLLGFCISIILTSIEPKSGFYLMPSRIWQFSIGALVYIAGQKEKWQKYKFIIHLPTLGLCLIALAVISITPETSYPGIAAILPTTGTALILLSGKKYNQSPLIQLLSNKAFTFIGDRSYSLYLWHWPLILLIPAILPPSQNAILTTILALIIITELNYRIIEIPFWRGNFSTGSTTHTLTYSIVTTLIVCVVFVTLPIIKEIASQDDEHTPNPSSLARGDKPIIYSMGCDSWYANSDLTPCLLGDKNAEKTVIVVGDSIGLQWLPAIQLIYQKSDWRIIVLTKSSCAMIDEDYIYKRIGKIYTNCTEWRRKAIEYIQELQPEVAYIGSAATYEFSKEQWINGGERVASKIAKASGVTFLIAGTPMLEFDGPSCIEKQETPERIFKYCSTNYANTAADKVSELLKLSIMHLDGIHLLNLNDFICPEKICHATSPTGIPIFRDQQHLTASYITSIRPAIDLEITKLSGSKE